MEIGKTRNCVKTLRSPNFTRVVRNTIGSLKAHFHSRKISTDRKFSENIIEIFLSAENFPEWKWALRWLDTVLKNSGVQHFEMFKLRIFSRIYSADIGFFIYFDNSTFKLY